MKKIIKLFAVLIMLVVITGCGSTDESLVEELRAQFIEEHESLNGQENEQGNIFSTMNIPEDHNVLISDEEEVLSFLENGTGVIYFGFPTCPWCRASLPVFLDVASNFDLNILYLNIHEIRDVKELVDGEVVTTEEGTSGYLRILEALGEHASVYRGLNDESIRRIYAPTFVFVQNGRVVGVHVGTVESQENPWDELTDEMTSELSGIFKGLFQRITGCGTTQC